MPSAAVESTRGKQPHMASAPGMPAPPAASKQDVNPWSVSGEVGEDGKVKAIDYRKLVEEFGTSQIDHALLQRFQEVTGHQPHRFMRRQIVFSHRDLSLILDRYEKVGSATRLDAQTVAV